MITRRRRTPDDPVEESSSTRPPLAEDDDPVIDLFAMDEDAPAPPNPTAPPEVDNTKWLLDQIPDPEPAPSSPARFDPGPPPAPSGTAGIERKAPAAENEGTKPLPSHDPEEPSLQYGGEPSGARDVDYFHHGHPEPIHSTLTHRPKIPRGTTMRIAIAATEFNYDITSMMVERARAHAEVLGAQVHHIVRVPGVFDLPLAVKRLLARDDVDGVAALGCVIEGETDHDDLVIQHAARKIIDLSLDTDKPVGLGITGPGMSRMQAMARIDRAKDAVEATYRMHQELAVL